MLVTVLLVVVGALWGVVLGLGIIEAVNYVRPKIKERFAKRRDWKETKEYIKKL